MSSKYLRRLLPSSSPISGDNIITRDEWHFSTDYVEYIVGLTEGNIIIVKRNGRGSVEDIRRYFEIIDSIIEEFGAKGTKFVVVEDLGNLKRSKSTTKKYYIKEMKKRDCILGVIYYNLTTSQKATIEFGRRMHITPQKVFTCKTFYNALALANKIFEKEGSQYSINKSNIKNRCPYSGLDLTEDQDYLNIDFNDKAYVSFRRIGDFIMFISIEGRADAINMKTLYKLKSEFYEKYFDQDGKYIEVIDWQLSSGRIRNFSLKDHNAEYDKVKGKLLALIPCNHRLSIAFTLKLAKLFIRPPFVIKSSKRVKIAILDAVKFYNAQVGLNSYHRSSFISNNAWRTSTPDLTAEIRIIPGKIFMISGVGYMTEEAADKVNALQSEVVRHWFHNNKSYYRIANYTHVTGGSVKGRYKFGSSLSKMLEEFKSSPKEVIVLGASLKVKAQINMASMFWPGKITHVETLGEALKYIKKKESKYSRLQLFSSKEKKEKERIFSEDEIRSEINRLVSYISSFSWSNNERSIPREFGRTELFKPLYETLTAVKADLDEVVDDREKAEKEMLVAHADLVKMQNLLIDEAIDAGRAEEANKAKTEFLSNMSHEIRTPMHGILNYARFGMKKIDRVSDEKLMHYFTTIKETSEQLLTVLTGLLDLSKLEAGKTPFNYEKFRLHELIMMVFRDRFKETSSKKININYLESDIDDYVEMDVDLLMQALVNVLSNAIKFSRVGGTIGVKVTKVDEESLKVAIFDGGVGIPEEERENIFGNFTQSSLTYDGAGGTGLGLPITKLIVEGHKGKIWVEESELGGASIVIQLPIVQPQEEKKAA